MFDEKKARRVIRFIECLKHTKGEFHGRPFKLLPWQEKIIRDVFGTVRDEDLSMRQYNQVYIEIGKKNGKSELGAALALTLPLAKGLEFDHVIIPDAGASLFPANDHVAQNRLYTTISRATRTITILSNGPLTPLLDFAHQD